MPLFEAQSQAIIAVFRDPSILNADNNLTRETNLVITKFQALYKESNGDDVLIAKRWHVFDEEPKSSELYSESQFDFRDELMEFAGHLDPESRVPDWVRDAYATKVILRTRWKELERRGEADDWVRGVGEGGVEEWIKLMKKILSSENI